MKRESLTTYTTTDGQRWQDYHEAISHEKFLRLRVKVDYLLRCSLGADAFAKALLDTEGLHIIVRQPQAVQEAYR
jgi:hypothetical protein